jgi:ABC-type transport system substrate-binding protein
MHVAPVTSTVPGQRALGGVRTSGSGRRRLLTMATGHRWRPWVVLAALLAVFSLAATACGGSDSGGSTDSAGVTDITVAASGSPKPGGSLVYGVEAESDGFNPTSNRWAISGLMVANAVFDPLAAFDADGKAQPYLAKAFTPSADFKTWTIELRDGVTFHDGTPLDGAAVKKDLDAVRASALTGAAAANVASVEVDPANPMNVIVTMTDPWASFPATMTGQVGFIAAPAQLDAGGEASSRQPIGTGPFKFKEWVPDSRWVGTKYENYWRTDSDGQKLPYLDQLEFRPIVDPQNRVNALVSGDIQMMHTTDWASINSLESQAESGNLQIVLDPTESEENFVLLNTTKPPLDDVRVRKALALCTDRNAVMTVWETPPDRIANSQFAEDSPWYDPNNGYPDMNVQEGTDLINQVEAEKGPVSFTLVTTPVPINTAATQLLAQQWGQCGMDVQLSTSEQSKFISDAVTGNYQANLWRQFSASDPDGDYVWWIGRNASGPLALNMARLSDPQVDEALNKARASDDPDVRKQAYAQLQERQSQLFPYIWIAHTQWAIGAANNVRNLTNVSLPDGQPALPFQSGNERLTETWIDG